MKTRTWACLFLTALLCRAGPAASTPPGPEGPSLHPTGLIMTSECGRKILERSGDLLLVRDADGRVRHFIHPETLTSGQQPRVPGSPAITGGTIGLVQVAVLDASRDMLAGPAPIDFDGDGLLEFIVTEHDTWAKTLRIYESTGDDKLSLAHTLNVSGSSSIYLSGIADGDDDGDLEILIYGRTSNDFWVRTYEQTSSSQFPTDSTFEIVPHGNWWASHAETDDLDADGAGEIAYSMQSHDGYIALHENDGDDAYTKVFDSFLSLGTTGVQHFAGGLDLDGDGKQEIVVGGFEALLLLENVADDDFIQVWETDTGLNTVRIIDTDDIDDDGLGDFLFVGFGPLGETLGCHYRLFEASGRDDGFGVVWAHHEGTGIWGDCEAIVGDLDMDGHRELIAQTVDSTFNHIAIYEAASNDHFTTIWSYDETRPNTVGLFEALATADLDGDGLPELAFNSYDASTEAVRTLIYEATAPAAWGVPASLTGARSGATWGSVALFLVPALFVMGWRRRKRMTGRGGTRPSRK